MHFYMHVLTEDGASRLAEENLTMYAGSPLLPLGPTQ